VYFLETMAKIRLYSFRSHFQNVLMIVLLVVLVYRMTDVCAAETDIRNLPASGEISSGGVSKESIRNGILIGEVPLIALFGAKAWDWSGNHSFYAKNEGWFGADTDYGGMDKAGHLFAHYMIQRSMYSLFDWTENGDSRKWLFSLGSSMSCGLLIELGDGFSSKYGFSFQDLTVDYAGILFGALLDRFPLAGGFVGLSAGFFPTDAYLANYKGESAFAHTLGFVNDYSGWTFMLNIKPAGFEQVGVHVPLVFRLLQFDVGYYTRGYSNYDKGKYARPHERDFCVGISINFAQLFTESWSSESRGAGYSFSRKFLEYYHIPADKEVSNRL
jgi:uncharacterized protein YfiM (DUF2279 family)